MDDLDRDLPLHYDGPIWRIFYWCMGYGDRRWYWVSDPDRPHGDVRLARVGDYLRDRDGGIHRITELTHLHDEVYAYTRAVYHTMLTGQAHWRDGAFIASCAPVRGAFLPRRRYRAICAYPHLYVLPPLPVDPLPIPEDVVILDPIPDSVYPWPVIYLPARVEPTRLVLIAAEILAMTLAVLLALAMLVLFQAH